MRDNDAVTYTGPDFQGVIAGDQATVVSAEERGAWVLWHTGMAAGQFDVVDNRFLALGEAQAETAPVRPPDAPGSPEDDLVDLGEPGGIDDAEVLW